MPSSRSLLAAPLDGTHKSAAYNNCEFDPSLDWSQSRMKKRSMTGSVAANPHEGSRSEILADYLFSTWGTVSPVRRQDDYGVDLYCTLTERIGKRARVRDYFAAQVKSTEDPWVFNDRESVRWLVEHPIPLFLCTISKRKGRLRVYHVFPRFYAWAMGTLPNRLELNPGKGRNGEFVQWENGSSFSLSAPIIEAGLGDLLDAHRMKELRDIFAYWVRLDRENCDLVRQGLLRFRMPVPYRVNELPTTGIGELGNAVPELVFLARGILRLAEAIECIGGQLGQRGDRAFALEAALLLDRIQKEHANVFEGDNRWRNRVPGLLGQIVNQGLNGALGNSAYLYAGLDAVETTLASDPLIKKYLDGS